MATLIISGGGSSISSSTATTSLFVTRTILPIAASTPYLETYLKLLVDDVEIPIRAARWAENNDTIGRSGNITLARLSDKDLITGEALITLQKTDRSGTVLDTIFTDAKVSSNTFRVANDFFSFSIISDASEKLNTCLSAPLVIFNPEKTSFDEAEVEAVRDVLGNELVPETIENNDLMVSDVIEEVVSRCGFDGWDWDIEDFPAKRADFDFGEPVIEGIKPLIGMFSAGNQGVLITEENNCLKIRDVTMLKSDGFPTPPDITVERVTDYSVNRTLSFADYAQVLFSTSGEYDGYIPRFDAYEEEVGSEEDGTYQKYVFLDIYAQFYANTLPDVIQDELLVGRSKTTYNGAAVLSNKIREDLYETSFDKYGRITQSTNRVNELVPDLDNPGSFIWKENVENNTTYSDFAQHPQQNRRQYQKRIKTIKTGLQVVDTSNAYEWNRTADEFTQSYRSAHRSGNIASGMTYRENQPLETFLTRFKPLRNGMVSFERSGHDFTQNTPLFDLSDQRAGDVSVNGSQGQANRVVVGAADDTPIAGRKISVSIGELPLDKGIPLSRRILKRLKEKNRNLSLSYIGLDSKIKRGAEFSVSDKDFNFQGSFLCISFECEAEMTESGATYSTSLEAIEI